MRALRVAAIVTGSLLVSSGASRAQTASYPGVTTETEDEALSLLRDELFVSARTAAERALRENEDSIVGHYVLGRAYFDSEGSLARAMFHLGRARELHERSTSFEGPFHQELLFSTARLAGQMELHEFQLELLGYYDHLYDPDMVAERCWPLIKLGRIDEAREAAEIAIGSPNEWQRSAGLNALCAVEGEARSRNEYHTACLGALAAARAEAEAAGDGEREAAGIAVDAHNAALAALAALEFETAEGYALEGVRRFEPTGANPWRLLVELYLSESRVDAAIEAFAQMVRWMDRQPAALQTQSRAETEAVVALIMLIGGESELARDRIERALSRPDRRGLTTDGAEQARGRHAIIRSVIMRTLEQERAERASWTGRIAQLGNALRSTGASFRAWPDRGRVASVVTGEGRLNDALRPYMPGGIDGLSPWLAPELIDIVGPAVFLVGVDDAERRDRPYESAHGYYDALRAEAEARARRRSRSASPRRARDGGAQRAGLRDEPCARRRGDGARRRGRRAAPTRERAVRDRARARPRAVPPDGAVAARADRRRRGRGRSSAAIAALSSGRACIPPRGRAERRWSARVPAHRGEQLGAMRGRAADR